MTLLDRLDAKIGPPVDLGYTTPCRLWKGAGSRSGFRNVCYPHIRHDGDGRHWRVNRLLLILRTAPKDCPQLEWETFSEWLERANYFYRAFDAAHVCQTSMCCEPEHLEWQTTRQNRGGANTARAQREREHGRTNTVANRSGDWTTGG